MGAWRPAWRVLAHGYFALLGRPLPGWSLGLLPCRGGAALLEVGAVGAGAAVLLVDGADGARAGRDVADAAGSADGSRSAGTTVPCWAPCPPRGSPGSGTGAAPSTPARTSAMAATSTSAAATPSAVTNRRRRPVRSTKTGPDPFDPTPTAPFGNNLSAK